VHGGGWAPRRTLASDPRQTSHPAGPLFRALCRVGRGHRTAVAARAGGG